MSMPLAIGTNVGSIRAQGSLLQTSRALNKSIKQLSSGKRITSSADDPAGMALGTNMNAQLKGYKQALRNANDGIAVLQTAESGYQSISDLLVRMRELAVQAANDSLSDTERGYLDTEFSDLVNEVDRISSTVTFNRINLLDGTAGTSGTMTFQVGVYNATTDRVTFTLPDVDATSIGINATQVDTLANAQSAIDDVDAALESLETNRAGLGASIHTLESAADHLTATIENYGAAVSQIVDTDMASTSAEFSKAQVMQQSGVAMIAQANAAPQLALRLLGG